MMNRLILRFTLMLLVSMTLVTFVALIVGRMFSGAIMLTLLHLGDDDAALYLYDVPRHIAVEFVSANLLNPPPIWSDDGRIAFLSIVDGSYDVFVWDGYSITRVTQTADIENGITWSADGRLAFSANPDGNFDIFVWDGTTVSNITQTPDLAEDFAAWSADNRLAFRAMGDGSDILVWDGATIINASQTPRVREAVPASWSLDGRLFFMSYQENEWHTGFWDGTTTSDFETVYRANSSFTAVGSAEGRVAIRAVINGNADIFLWDSDGITNLTQTPNTIENDVRWNANGQLAYSAENSENYDLYIWDGVTITNITNTPHVDERLIAWWTP